MDIERKLHRSPHFLTDTDASLSIGLTVSIAKGGNQMGEVLGEVDVWAEIARSYSAFRPPFVPSLEDVRVYENAVSSHSEAFQRSSLKAAILGVTPSLVCMNWPPNAIVVALEKSTSVIRELWPGDVAGKRLATCASWFDLPELYRGLDVIVGDGAVNVCRYPVEVHALRDAIVASLSPGGLLVLRSYTRDGCDEEVQDVLEDLEASNDMSIDCFKMRLFLAMQEQVGRGVAVRDAAAILSRYGIYGREHFRSFGWSDAAIEPMMMWVDSPATYMFPSLNELLGVFATQFECIDITYPRYLMGSFCPIVVMKLLP